MQLGAVMKRIGAAIVKEKVGDESATFLLRVDPEHGDKWQAAITGYLLAVSGKPFTVDISKYFYVQNGAIKYLWRIVINGDVTSALSLLGSCALEASMAHVKELDSFPLVGRVRYPFNLALGQLKGAHDIEQSQLIVSQAMGAVRGTA